MSAVESHTRPPAWPEDQTRAQTIAHLVIGRHQDTTAGPIADIAGFGSRLGHLAMVPDIRERHGVLSLLYQFLGED